jgi:hypothetical protein
MSEILMLVATRKTQGQRKSDFCWVPEGELVGFAFECDADRGNVDGRCGCRRAMSGVFTHKATTTMKVARVDEDDAKKAICDGLRVQFSSCISDPEIEAQAEQDFAELARIAESFGEGAIVEKRGSRFNARRLAA